MRSFERSLGVLEVALLRAMAIQSAFLDDSFK